MSTDYNVKDDDLNYIFDWFEANDKKIKLDNIKKVLDKESNKRGRKTAEYSLIKSLKDRDMTDIAIYTGMALLKTNLSPKWTIDEVMNLLESKNFIDKELIPLLSREYLKNANVTIPQMKNLALKIQENVLKNERETIDYIRNTFDVGK